MQGKSTARTTERQKVQSSARKQYPTPSPTRNLPPPPDVQCSTGRLSCQRGPLTGHVLDLVIYHSLELLELLLPE